MLLAYPPLLLLLLFLVLPSTPFLECGRRGAAATPGTALGSRRLRQPWRPARALPRPGPHGPISEEPLGGVGGRSAKAREDALRSATGAEQEGRGRGPLFMPVWRRPFPTSELRLRQLRLGSLWRRSGLGPCSRSGPGAFGPCSWSGLLVLAPSLGLGASARRGDASFLLH